MRKTTNIETDEVNKVNLLKARPFSYSVNAKSVVTSNLWDVSHDGLREVNILLRPFLAQGPDQETHEITALEQTILAAFPHRMSRKRS